ncbi:unnamed protein product [Nezara viridula]|uniref:Uncharacterized protein n=1 Tax=Nezara viridula TaxID=85310 RepID=A0A9P0HT55_NEZVI|nr:unnamed protein product [Nezara viridula]
MLVQYFQSLFQCLSFHFDVSSFWSSFCGILVPGNVLCLSEEFDSLLYKLVGTRQAEV